MCSVYEQIEHLSEGPKNRRSKSFSGNDRQLGMSSTHQDLSAAKDGLPMRSRLSSESGMPAATGSTPGSVHGSRSSFEMGRTMKMFMTNNKSSIDRDADSSQINNKLDSVLGESSRQASGQSVLDSTTVEVDMFKIWFISTS